MAITIHGTTGIVTASWTTGNRPSSPVAGQQGYNTTLKQMEVFLDTTWEIMAEPFTATGGTKTTSGDYTIHTFTTSGIFTPIRGNIVDYFPYCNMFTKIFRSSWFGY